MMIVTKISYQERMTGSNEDFCALFYIDWNECRKFERVKGACGNSEITWRYINSIGIFIRKKYRGHVKQKLVSI